MRPGRNFRELLPGLMALGLAVFLTGPAWSQDPAASPADTLSAATDTLSTQVESEGLNRLQQALAESREQAENPPEESDAPVQKLVSLNPFLVELTNTPKAGIRANVRQYTYYGEFLTSAKLRDQATVTNTILYSWDEFRKQDTTIEKRSEKFLFTSGSMMPGVLTVDGKWDWNEDKTINTAGRANLSKRDAKQGKISLKNLLYETGNLSTKVRGNAGTESQKKINREQRDDFTQAEVDVGVQSGFTLSEGVILGGRFFSKFGRGDQSLSQISGNTSASADSVGFGVYFDRGLGKGWVKVTRGNFERKYLDYLRNSNGSPDTLGVDSDEWVVDELETRDALNYDFLNDVTVGRLSLRTALTRVTDDLAYAASGVGTKERLQDKVDLRLIYEAERDSLVIKYNLLWKWDDQRFQAAPQNRGRQYNKNRRGSFTWFHTLFRNTRLAAGYEEGLSQDVAQFEYNQNDKDRHQRGINVNLDREWRNRFNTGMAFAYLQTRDIAIRETRSSNNNEKSSYEISPGYDWTLSDRLRLRQEYRIYIEYTDYIYSDLPVVNRNDNYNKRGNLTTVVTMYPTERLDVTVRHDYNRRFNATKTGVDATGSSFYFKDKIQTVSRIDLGLTFRASPWMTLQGATYSNKDTNENLGPLPLTLENTGGQVWVGCIVDKKWGAQGQVELSAMVKKYYMYGPGITDTSADYWVADAYLSWGF